MSTKRCIVSRQLTVTLLLMGMLALGQVGPASAAPTIIYVKWDAGGLNNGTSWANAYKRLEFALNSGSSGQEIWVATGTYKPGDWRAASFVLKTNGLEVYGGFAGGETQRSQRQPAVNVTILSGEIGAAGIADNLYHVFQTGYTDRSAVLDGFTITGGNANGADPDDRGGGLYLANGNPTLRNLIFSGNSASTQGGGMYSETGMPRMSRIIFRNNSTAGFGGGMANTENSFPEMTDVAFQDNSAEKGGGLSNITSDPLLTNVTFTGNSASLGGGVFNHLSMPQLTNATFAGNSAVSADCAGTQGSGGAIFGTSYWASLINGATFAGNSASCHGDAAMNADHSGFQISNSIFWGNGAEEFALTGGGAVGISDSIVQGGCPSGATCTDVVDSDPVLGTLRNNGGFTKTEAPGANSSAIDYGDDLTCPEKDQRGLARPQGDHCDIGAVEVRTMTFTSLGANDGWVLEAGEETNVGGPFNSTSTTIRLGDHVLDRQNRGLVSFNTSGLPDAASVVRAGIKIRKQSVVGTDPFGTHGALKIDVKKPYFGAGVGLLAEDFQAAASMASAGRIGSTPTGTWYAGLLKELALPYVNKTGPTQIRLRFSLGDNDDLSADQFILYSGEAGAANRPRLIVYYNP